MQGHNQALRPAAGAFEAIAPLFDSRFGAWKSVAAQRRAVRRTVFEALAPNSFVLEIGGGTGEDAVWLASRGHTMLTSDAAPSMVAQAGKKLAPLGGQAALLAAEDLEDFAKTRHGMPLFDAAFSNFAALNCVEDLAQVGRGLARLVRPGGLAMLVLFGTFCPGEWITECLRGRPRAALRRHRRGPAAARLAQRDFTIVYHRKADLAAALAPWFVLQRRLGVGVFVPPSAAEPWISAHPALLGGMERWDRRLGGPLAPLGDHVLYIFRRSDRGAP